MGGGGHFVRSTVGRIDLHGAHIDLNLGPCGEDAPPRLRSAVSLEYRDTAAGPSVCVTDADSREIAQSSLAGRALQRSEVIGSPIAAEAFAIVDAVLRQDPRLNGAEKPSPHCV